MTLLIATIRPQDALVTADGRSTLRAKGVVTGVDDRYQKIHPIPDHPLLIAHHGDNLLSGKPVKDFLAPFIKTLNPANHTIAQIADQLREYAHAPVRARLKALGKGFASGFWIIGFDDTPDRAGERRPRGVELFWKWEGDHLTYEEREWKPITVVAGGDGKKQIPGVSFKEIENATLDKVRAYHKTLMDAAIATDMKDNPVGGHVHELRLSAEKWTWTIPPATPERH
jgi:hypothetical protein